MLRSQSISLCLILSVLLLATASFAEEGHDQVEVTERPPVTEVPATEAIVEINGLVCSFCAFGVEKAVKKLPFLDGERFSSGVEVDINTHQMRLALKTGEPIDYKRLALSLRAGGYEPLDIYLRVRGKVVQSEAGLVLSGPGVEYALQPSETLVSPSDEPIQVLLRIDGSALHELPAGAKIRANAVRLYES